MHARWMSWREKIQFHGGRSKAWWVIGAIVIVLLVAAIVVTEPGKHAGSKQASVATQGLAPSHGAPTSATSTTSASAGAAAAASTVQSSSASDSSAQSAAVDSQSGSIGTPSGRMVIETANLDLTVSQVSKGANDISSLTAASGGFVESMNQSTDNQGQTSEVLTIRIPEGQFQTALQHVKALGKVNVFSQTGQDVTNQHDNLQQQISELQSEAQAYTRLFDKATKMSDMLEIQQSLTRVNSQLANLNNQLAQLDHTVQFATLHITLHPSVVPIQQGSEPFWAPFVQSLHFMDRVGVGLSKVVGWLLPWGILGGLLYGGVRLWRRGRAPKA